MKRKLLTLMLALVMVMTAVPAFAIDLLEAGDRYPIDTDKTVSFYAQYNLSPHEAYKDWTESPFHTNLAKQTGINIEWLFPTVGADANAYTNTLVAEPSKMPNIMQVGWMNDAQDYLDREIIWDLTPYLEEYAPAFYAFLKANPAYDKALKTDNGQYYTFGFFREDGGWNDSYLGPVIRTDWLDELGLEAPTTISEFEEVLRAFYDEYGAKFAFAMNRFNTTGLSGAFGAYGSRDMQFFIEDGKVSVAQYEPEWRDYMSWLNMLWDEGLLDQDSLSENDTTIKTKVHGGQVGLSITSMGQLNNWDKEEVAMGNEPMWEGIQYPKGDDGTLSMIFGGPGIGTATVVISKQSTDEETMKLCLQLLDYAFTQEGFLFWNYGVQGESWDYGEDGTPTYLPEIMADTATDWPVKWGGTTWGPGCCIQATKMLYMKNAQVAIDANDIWFYPNEDVTSKWKWPVGASFTIAESEELAGIRSQISTLISEHFANFVSGALDVDDDAVWDNYIATLESMQIERMIEIYQGCYDRYLER